MEHLTKHIAGKLYDGIVNSEDWYLGLDALRQALGGALFYNFSVDISNSNIIASLGNLEIPQEIQHEYERYHAHQDERMPIVMSLPVGGLMFDHERFTQQDFSKSFIYNDWLPSLGFRHTFCTPLNVFNGTREFLTVMRSSDQKAFDINDRMLLEVLVPDLLRATRLKARMAHVTEHASLGIAALDVLSKALAVVDAERKVHYANAAAQYIWTSKAQGWHVSQGRVCAGSADLQAWLERAVSAACFRGAIGPITQAFTVAGQQRHSAGGNEGTLSILPLTPEHPLSQIYGARPYALLVWEGYVFSMHAHLLTQQLGLTLTEASLALALAHGLTLKVFAQAQGCSWHTARTHMKNVLQKTGLHRQQDVVTLVRSLV